MYWFLSAAIHFLWWYRYDLSGDLVWRIIAWVSYDE